MAESKVMIGLIGPSVAVSGEFPRKMRNTVEWFSRRKVNRPQGYIDFAQKSEMSFPSELAKHSWML